MKFSCTLGTLRAKLDSMEDLFGDKIKAEFVSYNGSVTVRKDDREELRHQAYNYLLRFPNLGFVLRLGDVCWWYEEEQRKELRNPAVFWCSDDGRVEYYCAQRIDDLFECYAAEENVSDEELDDLECVIETEFEAEV